MDWSKDGLRPVPRRGAGQAGLAARRTGHPGRTRGGQGIRRDLLRGPERGVGEVQGLRHVCRLSRAAGEGEGRQRGQDHDAGPPARDDRHRGHEEGQARRDAQAAGQPVAGGAAGDRDGSPDEGGNAFPAGKRRRDIREIKAWIDAGAIGTLREIHNWSNRPVWPQYPTIPTDRPPVPEGFDWELWLGPSLDRPYHPHYTHAVFRGWYEFGGGALADMGHYSLWPVFRLFELDAPVMVESRPSHVCTLEDHVAVRIQQRLLVPGRLHHPVQVCRQGRPAGARPVLV